MVNILEWQMYKGGFYCVRCNVSTILEEIISIYNVKNGEKPPSKS